MTTVYNKFNRGEVDDLALARDDVTRVNDSASYINNFIPQRLGPMSYRPGMAYQGAVADPEVYLVPFFASMTSTALLEFTDSTLRIWADDALVSSSAVTTTITNGLFTSNISGWTDDSDAGASTSWDSSGAASLTGSGSGLAVLYQTIAGTDTGSEHTLTVTIQDAPATISIGTSGSRSDEIFSGSLLPGTHSLVFTPGSNITITLSNSRDIETLVDSLVLEGTGVVELPTSVAGAQLSSLRYAQSADVMFFAYDNGPQFRVERRGVKSWSIAEFRADDGPFGFINTSDITLSPAALSGNTTLTASRAYFNSDHVGTLFKLISAGQNVSENVTAEDNGTNSIFVTGVGSDRQFTVSVFIGATSTVTLQRSTDDATWTDVESYTVTTYKTFNDELDNSELYYRLWVKTGDYGSSTNVLSLSYSGGSIEGICRVTGYTSPTAVSVQVLDDFGASDATADWYAGSWGGNTGYPSSVELYEGRLWWAGKSRVWASVTDAFVSFDDRLEGNDAPISRTVGFGPTDTINWLAVSSRLIMGVASDEISVRSSSFGEVLTSLNTNLKSGSSQGAAAIGPIRVDDDVLFVQRSLVKIMNLAYAADRDTHRSTDLMTINQSICAPGIKRMAVVRQPETRVFVVLDDGTARVFTMDQTEDVKAWSRLDTDGDIVDVTVLPETGEDRVYFVVTRDNGTYLEKMAKFSDAVAYHYDSYVTYASGGPTVSGLSHLNGQTVYVWHDNAVQGSYTVSGGQINIGEALGSEFTVGLRFTADYTSNKLSHYVNYSVLNRRKRVESVGIIARNMYRAAVQIGPDSANLFDMPTQEQGAPVSPTDFVLEYDEVGMPFDGSFKADSRIHIRATGPVTFMALTYEIEESKSKASN